MVSKINALLSYKAMFLGTVIVTCFDEVSAHTGIHYAVGCGLWPVYGFLVGEGRN